MIKWDEMFVLNTVFVVVIKNTRCKSNWRLGVLVIYDRPSPLAGCLVRSASVRHALKLASNKVTSVWSCSILNSIPNEQCVCSDSTCNTRHKGCNKAGWCALLVQFASSYFNFVLFLYYCTMPFTLLEYTFCTAVNISHLRLASAILICLICLGLKACVHFQEMSETHLQL